MCLQLCQNTYFHKVLVNEVSLTGGIDDERQGHGIQWQRKHCLPPQYTIVPHTACHAF